MQGPETRASLIASLNDPASKEVWDQFAAIYRPLIIRVALARGMQHADAEDLAQEVLSAVGDAIGSFQSKGEGSFRRWLYTITRNLVVNRLTRGPFSGKHGPVATGDSAVQRLIDEAPALEDSTESLFQLEYRRAQFQHAAETVRNQFSESTWQCFWLTSVGNQSAEQAGSTLGKSPGAVRVARCRVLAAIRAEIQPDAHEQD